MAGQYLDKTVYNDGGDYVNGINLVLKNITYFSGGTREGLMVSTHYINSVAVSEDGTSVIKFGPTNLSGNTIAYTVLKGTDANVQTAFAGNHRLIYPSTDTGSEYYYYDTLAGQDVPSGLDGYDEFCGDRTSGSWVDGVDNTGQRLSFEPIPTIGSLANRLLTAVNIDMILISEVGNAVIQVPTFITAQAVDYTLLGGSSNAEVQTGFGHPNQFRVILKDDNVGTEWKYYDDGGVFPFAAGAPTTGDAVARMEGFGNIANDSADLLANGWDAAGGSRAIAGGRFGGTGYKLNALTQVLAEFAGSVATEPRWGVTYWAKWTTIGADSNIYRLDDAAVTGSMATGNSAHANVVLKADGSLELFTASVSRGSTAPGLIVATTWHHIEVRVFIDDALGTAEVWVDGVSVIAASSVDTLFGTTTNVTTTISAGTSTECIIDDLLLVSSSTDRLALHQIHDLLPDGAGDNSAWTGDVTDVDDPLGTPDEDATYISSKVALDKQDHTFQDLPGGVTLIVAVEVSARARVNDGAALDLVQYTISGPTETDGGAQVLTSAYVNRKSRLNQDPNTAADWVVAGVNALKIGVKPEAS